MATRQTESPAAGDVQPLGHVRALDGLRGLAVAAVLLFHGGHLTGGYLGVDLFFVLSGFLITSLLLVELGRRGRVDLPHFWGRRARRLLPALFAVLLAVAVYARFLADPTELHRIRYDGIATLFYVANWRALFSKLSYWELFVSPSPLTHTWSLAIEEQFYLVWPLVVAGVAAWVARGRRAGGDVAVAVLVVAGGLAAVSATLMMVLYRPGLTDRVYYGSDTRAAAILVGAGLAAWRARSGAHRRHPAWSRRRVEVAGLLGAGVLAVAWTRVPGESWLLYRGGFLTCAIAAAAVIAAAVHTRPGGISRVLSVRPLVALGLISYGVYLWHWPVFVWLNGARTGLDGWALFTVQVAVTLAISIVSYYAIEQPIRHGAGSAFVLRRLTPALAIGLVVVLLAGTGGFSTPRVPVAALDPLPPPTLPAPAAEPIAHLSPATATTTGAAAVPATTPSTIPPPRRMLVVGNSVAWYLASDGFKALGEPGLTVVNRAYPSCTFPPGVTHQRDHDGRVYPNKIVNCASTWVHDVGVVRPDLVLFALNDFGDGADQHNGTWIHPCTPEFDSWYTDSLRQAVGTLQAHGARVALVTSAYLGSVAGPTLFTQDDCVNDITRQVALSSPNTVLVDLASYICPTHMCRLEQDGVTLRPDGVHYRGAAARMVAGWIWPQLLAAPGTSGGPLVRDGST